MIKYYKSGERYAAILPDKENFIKVYDYISVKSVHTGNNPAMVKDIEQIDKEITEAEFREVMDSVVEHVSSKIELFSDYYDKLSANEPINHNIG